MGAKPGFKLELPPEVKPGSVVKKQVYRGADRLLKDDPVWSVTHPGFSLARKIQSGEEFVLEVWIVSASRNVTLFLDFDKALLMMFQVISGAIHLAGCKEKSMRVARKKSLIGPVPPGRYTVEVSIGRNIFCCCYIKTDRFKKLAKLYPSLNQIASSVPNHLELFSSQEFKQKTVRLIYRTKGDKYRSALLGFSLDATLWELLRCALKTSTKNDPPENAGARTLVYRIKDYLDGLGQGRQKLPRIAELADQFSLHPHHLTRVFKEEFGMTPRDYLVYQKMQIGFTLLKEEKLPVNEVALALGYRNPYSFGRQFQVHFGFSPGKLLKSHEDLEDEM